MAHPRGEHNPLIDSRWVYWVKEMEMDWMPVDPEHKYEPRLIEEGDLEGFLKSHPNTRYIIMRIQYETIFQY